ncbi:MAG: aminoglycoside adenylyltransferase domain-containing protein [Myxococcota bacterium]
MYLYGSLATGDFSPATSDVDFVVVTDREVSDAEVAALGAMHARLAASGGLAASLEGSYIPRDALRRWDPATARHPHLAHDRPFQVEEHGPDWVIQRHVLREHGVVVAGPPPRDWIDPVTPAMLRESVAAVLREFWANHGSSDEFLRPRAYQVFAVQTMCRALHTLATGEIGTKQAAMHWARDALPARFRPAIERALAYPNGDQTDDLEGTRALIRFALERARAAA